MASVRATGRYLTNSQSTEPFKVFIPYPLPPEPPLNLSQAVATSRRILDLFQSDQQRIETLGRSLGTTLRIFKLLQSVPLISILRASQETAISVPTVTAALARLEELGIVHEVTSKRRDKLYSYEKYIGLLNEGTEAIKR